MTPPKQLPAKSLKDGAAPVAALVRAIRTGDTKTSAALRRQLAQRGVTLGIGSGGVE